MVLPYKQIFKNNYYCFTLRNKFFRQYAFNITRSFIYLYLYGFLSSSCCIITNFYSITVDTTFIIFSCQFIFRHF